MGDGGNQIGLWEKAAATGSDEMAEKKAAKTEKMLEGEIVYVLESEREAEGWNCWRMAENSTYSWIQDKKFETVPSLRSNRLKSRGNLELKGVEDTQDAIQNHILATTQRQFCERTEGRTSITLLFCENSTCSFWRYIRCEKPSKPKWSYIILLEIVSNFHHINLNHIGCFYFYLTSLIVTNCFSDTPLPF